jgi:cysteine desulfurase/selenocysteine lyase
MNVDRTTAAEVPHRVVASHPEGPITDAEIERLRRDFPILSREVNGQPLVYLDNAATTQKPRAVIETVRRYYEEENANIHRGIHFLSQEATSAYESARARIRSFLGARRPEEIIFVRGATEGINLVANSFVRPRVGAGDEILITGMEHHSNIVPWQMVCESTGAKLRVAPITDEGELDVEAFRSLLGPRTRFASIIHVSNALGTINPVKELVDAAHRQGVPVLLDGAQAVAHGSIDVAELDCEFYVFSGHKIFAPTGIGVLYGKKDILDEMPPYQGGGDMILSVSFEKTIYNKVPAKFEAGTPHISGTLGLRAALDYVDAIGIDRIGRYEEELISYATTRAREIDGLRLIGTARSKVAVLGFVLGDVHAHDVGTILDQQGIAVRVGHHCAQPVMDRFGVPATVRASFAFYNTRDEVDRLVGAIHRVHDIFR